ncbi:MAG: hypothetical protein H6722_01905 [Sandaracinus sp.]|nr:hypothetical protein [Sandaracinus sp.]MCB9611189.1 hypothetical protein [Sandaracinus sp.]MCB9621059.1 hypothetical protein [Sandaracinus sp.]MCB9623724.1 hypothetical protein [Sandaracinus sp.]
MTVAVPTALRAVPRSVLRLALVASLLAGVGCSERVPWVFRPGDEVDTTPTIVRAEVHPAEVCDRGCAVQSSPLYCGLFVPPGPGPRPSGLSERETYCFVGTAFDETGVAFARGCAMGRIGDEVPVEVTLDPAVLAERPTCNPRDAGLPDSGMPMDGGFDAGPPDGEILDAPVDVPEPDAGPGPFQLTVRTGSGGGMDVVLRLPGVIRTWDIPADVGSFTIPDELPIGTTVSFVPKPFWTNGHVEWTDDPPPECVPGQVCTFDVFRNRTVGARFDDCPAGGVCGDFDGNGRVETADADALREALSNRYAEGCAFWRGDVADARRTLSPEDATLIEQVATSGGTLTCDPAL